ARSGLAAHGQGAPGGGLRRTVTGSDIHIRIGDRDESGRTPHIEAAIDSGWCWRFEVETRMMLRPKAAWDSGKMVFRRQGRISKHLLMCECDKSSRVNSFVTAIVVMKETSMGGSDSRTPVQEQEQEVGDGLLEGPSSAYRALLGVGTLASAEDPSCWWSGMSTRRSECD
ncbi:hypothetical protein FOFC_15558, partial [Fusarium oxysporum]